jgi:hypothetical protein
MPLLRYVIKSKKKMNIDYKYKPSNQFIELLNNSTLDERRPVDDREYMEAYLPIAISPLAHGIAVSLLA